MPTEHVKRLISTERLRPAERAMTTPAVRRGVGLGIRRAYCKVDAGEDDVIDCYLDYNAHDVDAYASEIEYSAGDIVTDGGAAYRSLQDGNSGHAPASSTEWWQAIEVVEVKAVICGGVALNMAVSRLTAGKGPLYVIYDPVLPGWRFLETFQGIAEDCEE